MEKLSVQDSQILKEIIYKRQSVTPPFYDTDKKIEDDIIWDILECANRAPNHKRTEPWRFTVFTGAGLQEFARMQSRIYKEHAPAFSEVTLRKLNDFPLMCSHIIAVSMKRNEEDKLPEVEEIVACGAAIQNLFLAAASHGIASYISTGGVTYYPQTKEYVKLGERDKLLGFIHLGYPKTETTTLKPRGDVREKTRWVK